MQLKQIIPKVKLEHHTCIKTKTAYYFTGIILFWQIYQNWADWRINNYYHTEKQWYVKQKKKPSQFIVSVVKQQDLVIFKTYQTIL